ncbi:MAG: MurR/RpiR family transcriptional regulator [Clostridia bacterium]
MEEILLSQSSDMAIDIKSRMQSFTRSEKKLATYILGEFSQIPSMTTGSLSETCDVSKATVTRFVRSLGYESFRSFQIASARGDVATKNDLFVYGSITDKDSGEGVCRKVFENNIQALLDTMAVIDYSKLEAVADKIVSVRAIYIFAQGRSTVLAESFINRFYRLGFKCFFSSDPHTQGVYSSLASEYDMVLGISTYGRSGTVMRSMQRARNNGAYVVGLTSSKNTVMSDYADMMLYAVMSGVREQDFEPSCETVSQMLLVDCLYMLLVVKNKDLVRKCFLNTYQAIEEERTR